MELLDLDKLLAENAGDGRDDPSESEAESDSLAETGRIRALDSAESAPEEMVAPELIFPELAETSEDAG